MVTPQLRYEQLAPADGRSKQPSSNLTPPGFSKVTRAIGNAVAHRPAGNSEALLMVPRKNDGSEPLPVRIDGIPGVLRQCPQWVTWRPETRNGKATKVPYANDGRRASSCP